jgi:hypothetical protein
MTNNPDANGSLSPLGGEVDPALLAELTRTLLPYLGPYSITTVKRASRSTSDPQEIVRMTAQHIDDLGKREMFLKQAKRIVAEFRDRNVSTGSASPSQATGGRPASPLTPELMKRGETALAPIIGPLAGVLVTRYAGAATNSREFFERLAGHLRSAEERDSFFSSIRSQESLAGASH